MNKNFELHVYDEEETKTITNLKFEDCEKEVVYYSCFDEVDLTLLHPDGWKIAIGLNYDYLQVTCWPGAVAGKYHHYRVLNKKRTVREAVQRFNRNLL